MKFFVPVMVILAGLLIYQTIRMIRLATAAIGVLLLFGILGLWSISRQ